ncbi:hypothetical protein HCA58_02430 [Micromonospora sp. HNM0581]|uniref:hypothetical protein n=1 Tax=Micromonospora sp. HNM0581 TaxID=2716341 RepID=UPI00146DF806|nr:hypothetical protein [Micromonospora sp. HNM0581]NLU77267.1 hypothetical protein [Micromonospora sp. HNM0581]
MRVLIEVPSGRVLRLLAGEWYPSPDVPADRDALISTVAVGKSSYGGLVLVHGHECNHRAPDCDRTHCWDALVLVTAIRDNMAGYR